MQLTRAFETNAVMDLRNIDLEYRNEGKDNRSEYLSVDIMSQAACMDAGTLRDTSSSKHPQSFWLFER